jgi:hypothetical protein
MVQLVHKGLLELMGLLVLPVPLVHKALLVHKVQLVLPEQRMQVSSLVFCPSPTVEPDHLHRILWT